MTEELYDLEDKPVRAPCHTSPIDQIFGKYKVKTWDVEESVRMVGGGSFSISEYIKALKAAQKSLDGLHIGDMTYPTKHCEGDSLYQVPENKSHYLLEVNLSVSKAGEWEGKVLLDPGYITHQLFQPKTLANLIVEDLADQGIVLNTAKTKTLLCEALKPYVNRTLFVCVDRCWFRPWNEIEMNEK
jgi:hypothetical protein